MMRSLNQIVPRASDGIAAVLAEQFRDESVPGRIKFPDSPIESSEHSLVLDAPLLQASMG